MVFIRDGKASKQREQARAEMLPPGPAARWTTCERSWGEQNPRAGLEPGRDAAPAEWQKCSRDCRGLTAPEPIPFKGLDTPRPGGTDGLRRPAALPASGGTDEQKDSRIFFLWIQRGKWGKTLLHQPYCNRQIAQELETKRRDSRINVHGCSEQKLNSKQ